MIEFLLTNWKILAFGLIAIIEIIIFIIKKRPSVNFEEIILKVLPFFIKQAENFIGSGNGEEKLDFVIGQVKAYINKTYGLKADTYTAFIKKAIENILETPQKKGD